MGLPELRSGLPLLRLEIDDELESWMMDEDDRFLSFVKKGWKEEDGEGS